MFFLLRTAFWLGIVLILLPTFAGRKDAQPAAAQPSLSAGEAVTAATATVSDLTGFCSRQPEACKIGAQAAVVLGEKAQSGAKIVYDYFSDRPSRTDGAQPAAAAPAAPKAATTLRKVSAGSQDTLTAPDLAPAWRGPARKEGRRPI